MRLEFLPLGLVGLLVVSLVQAAWSRRQAFELRMQILELLELAIRRQLPLPALLRRAAMGQGRRARRVFTRLARDLESGEELAEALCWAAPLSFPPHVAAGIRAAEGGADLAPVLAGLVEQTDESLATSHRFSLALLYPLCLVFGVLFAREAVIGFYRSGATPVMLGTPTANPTADWWSLSDWFPNLGSRRFPPWLVAAATVLGGLLFLHSFWRGRPGLRRVVFDLFALVPWRPRSHRELAASRVLVTLSHLVAAGHPLPAAMRSAAGAAGSPAVAKGMQRAAESMEAGHAPVEAWPLVGLPPLAAASVAAASHSDPEQFTESLRRIARGCRERFVAARERFLDVLHPVGVVACGAVLAADAATLMSLHGYLREATGLW